MPIVIDEVVIAIEVEPGPAEAEQALAPGAAHEALVAECLQKLAALLPPRDPDV
jgi:Family of unknown function (DUF5908)